MLGFPLHGMPIKISDLNAGRSYHRHIAVVKKEYVARVRQKRRDIGSDEIFVIANANHHRRPVARGHNLVGLIF